MPSEKLWSADEKAAMRDTARERKAAARVRPGEERAAGEAAIQAAIAELPEPDRSIAQRVHEIVTAAAPDLVPRTFYGSPAWARDGKAVCFFQAKAKYKVRYHTFGCQPEAHLDDGDLWPIAFAIDNLTPAVERRLAEIARKAAN